MQSSRGLYLSYFIGQKKADINRQLYIFSELFQVYQHYLEEELKVRSYLIVESRSSGPLTDRPDPFTLNDADLGALYVSN